MKNLSTILLILTLVPALPACDDPIHTTLHFLRQISAHHLLLDQDRKLLNHQPGAGSTVKGIEGIGEIQGGGVVESPLRRAKGGYDPTAPRQPSPLRGKAKLNTEGMPTELRRALARRVLAFRNCYEHRLKMDPTLAGTLVFSLDIPIDGSKPSFSVLSDTVGDPEVAKCVSRKLRRIRFPTFDEPIHTEIRLEFKSVN